MLKKKNSDIIHYVRTEMEMVNHLKKNNCKEYLNDIYIYRITITRDVVTH